MRYLILLAVVLLGMVIKYLVDVNRLAKELTELQSSGKEIFIKDKL